MQHDHAEDEWGFWGEEPTRSLKRLLPGSRERDVSRQQPVVRARNFTGRRPARAHHSEAVDQVRVQTSAAGEPVDQTAGESRRPIDPLLARVGMMVLVVGLVIPLAMSMPSADGGLLRAAVAASATPSSTATSVAPTVESAVTTTVAPVVVEAALSPAAATRTDSAPSAKSVEHVATTVVCNKSYTVVAGDYWILIAKKASVTLKELLAANKATTSAALYPGRAVCLPSTASTPMTAAPTIVAKPTPTTVKPTPTTVKPTPTTVKPTPTTAAPAPPLQSYTKTQVAQIIRDVWPDELEDEAIRIATRESNLAPTAKNSCCYGLFQVYYQVHKGWLATIGITSATQLFDPRTNAYAGYVMYLRSNGWGPWKL